MKAVKPTTEPTDPLKQYQCRVCSAHATGFHFDAQSCSACAAFFRRTVALGKIFRCQNGDSCCDIVYTERNLCRKCRYDKCIAIGMKKGSVRPKKAVNTVRAYCTTSGLKRNKRFATSTVLNIIPNLVSPPPSQSTSETTSEIEEAPTILTPSSSTSPRSITEFHNPLSHAFYQPNRSTLKLLIDEEMRISERRRILFCERPVGSLLGVSNNCPFTPADIKPLSFRRFRKSIRTHILLIYEWLRAWPEYSMLGNHDQIALLRKCVLYHTVLDPCFITMQIGDMSKFVMPNGGYVSTRADCDDGWQDEKEISRDSKKMIYWPLLDGLMNTIVQPMMDMAITFEEFVALKALVSFQGTMCDISDSGRPIMKQTLEHICRSLHELVPNGEEKAMRFGNIVLLLSPVFDTALNFVESHHKVHFFDLWHLDSLLLQFLKNKAPISVNSQSATVIMAHQLGSTESAFKKVVASAEGNASNIVPIKASLLTTNNITEGADSLICATIDRVEESLKALRSIATVPTWPALGPLTVSQPFVSAPIIMLNLSPLSPAQTSGVDSTQHGSPASSDVVSFELTSVGDVQFTQRSSLSSSASLTDLRTPLEDNSLPSIEFGNFGSLLNPGEIQVCNLEAPLKVYTERRVHRNAVGELHLIERVEIIGEGVIRGAGDFVKLVPTVDCVGIEPVPILATHNDVLLGHGQIVVERSTRLIQTPRRGALWHNAAGHVEYHAYKSDLQDAANRVSGVISRIPMNPESKYGLIGPLNIVTRRELQRLHDGDYRAKDVITIEVVRDTNDVVTAPTVDGVEVPYRVRNFKESDANGTKKVDENVRFGDGVLTVTRVLEIGAFSGINSSFSTLDSRHYQTGIESSVRSDSNLSTARPMLTGDDTSAQGSLNTTTPSGSIRSGRRLSPMTGSTTSTLKAYRNFGRPISASKPLTATSPNGRRVDVARSPYTTHTALAISPRSHVSSTGTTQENSPLPRTGRSRSPMTARGASPTPMTALDRSPVVHGVSPGAAIRTAAAASSFSTLNSRHYQTGIESSVRSDPNFSTARPMLTGDDTSARGSLKTTTSSDSIGSERQLSPLAGSTSPEHPRKQTPAEQWANVKPGPGPRIVPATAKPSGSNVSVHTAREKQPSKAAPPTSRLVPNKKQSSKDLWDELLKAAKAAGVPIQPKSPGLAAASTQEDSPVNTCRPLDETVSETNIHTAITRSPVGSYKSMSPGGRGGTDVVTGRGLSARDPPSGHTAREIGTSPLRKDSDALTGRGLSAREQRSGFTPRTTSPLRSTSEKQPNTDRTKQKNASKK